MKPPEGLNITDFVSDAVRPEAAGGGEEARATTEIWLGAVLTDSPTRGTRRRAPSRVLDDVKQALEHEQALRRLAARSTLGTDDLLQVLEAHFDDAPDLARSSRHFSRGEEAALSEAGVNVDGPPPGGGSRDVVSLGRLLASHAQSLTVSEAAKRLGRTPGRVRQRIMDRSVYAFRVPGGEWRLPDWQFVDEDLVPGLEAVIPRLQPGMHPLSVRGFMLTPNPDLLLADEPVSPLAWLTTGGDAAVVAQLAADLPAAT